MSDDANKNFVNKYIQVLKNKYDQQTSDLISIEAQMIILRENVEILSQENEALKAEVEKLKSKPTSSKSTE